MERQVSTWGDVHGALVKLVQNSWDFTDEHAQKILESCQYADVYLSQRGTLYTGYQEIIKGVGKMAEETNTEKKLAEISQGISWHNWDKEDEEGIKNEEYFKVTEVLYCQLGWVIEEGALSDEHKDILERVQGLIEAMGKDNYKSN